MFNRPPSKEEGILTSFFNHLSTFSYDRARDLMEKEKDTGCKGSLTRWSQLVSLLVQLCTAEKQYINLTFLQARSFLRKDSTLKHMYETMICELERLLECNEAVEAEDIITHLSTDLGVILKGRLKSMDVYEKLNNSNKLTVYAELQVVLRFISKTVKDVHSVAVEGWKQVFYLEIGILYDSVRMCISMGNCDFYNSTTFLQSLTDKLSTWADILLTRETRKLSFATSLLRGVSGQSEPHLYMWFYKLKAALLSKFSIYFYSVLLNQSGGDMRALTSKLPVDHPNRLISFHRRTDALTVCIVFEGTGLSGFRGPGYFFQTDRRDGGSPTGLELFPAVFYHPLHPSQQQQQWPNIVMILSDKDYELNQNRLVHFYDAGINITYFLQMIDLRFTLVALFEGRRPDRDSTINTFFQETVQQLRLTRVMCSLKPGVK